MRSVPALLRLTFLGWLLLAGVAGSVVEAAVLPENFAEDVVVETGLAFPVGFAFLPDGRALIIEQGGQVRLVVNGSLVPTPLLIVPEVDFDNERGLLGVAVDPDFPARPFIYVFYSALSGPCAVGIAKCSHLARYRVGGNLGDPGSTNLTIDPSSREFLINHIRDDQVFHNGGTLRFGIDKLLYISIGEDNDACAAQDVGQLKGKILRVKVDDSIIPGDLATMIPAGNPFAGSANVNAQLVWAYGLRNPFRISIDPLTGVVFVGDVGHDQREEANRVSSGGGDNFGWPYWEGTFKRNPICPLPEPANPVPPILEYSNAPGANVLDAIIGGPVYKAPAGAGSGRFPPNYQGVYFAADYYRRFLYALRFNCATGLWDKIRGATTEFWATELAAGVADMAVGPDGALYYIAQNPPGGAGSLRRIRYTGPHPGPTKTFTVPPCRVLDTRAPDGGGPLAGDACRAVRVTGSGLDQGGQSTCGIPPEATGVHINVTTDAPVTFGHLTVFPFGWSPPLASTLNFAPGQVVANGFLAPICDEGLGSPCPSDLVLQAGPSATHVVVDVTGYIVPAAP